MFSPDIPKPKIQIPVRSIVRQAEEAVYEFVTRETFEARQCGCPACMGQARSLGIWYNTLRKPNES